MVSGLVSPKRRFVAETTQTFAPIETIEEMVEGGIFATQ